MSQNSTCKTQLSRQNNNILNQIHTHLEISTDKNLQDIVQSEKSKTQDYMQQTASFDYKISTNSLNTNQTSSTLSLDHILLPIDVENVRQAMNTLQVMIASRKHKSLYIPL